MSSVDVAVWLECTMNRVSDGDRSTLLSFVSCGASQGYAPQSGEIIGILKQLMAAQEEDEDRKANHTGLVASKVGSCHFDSNDRDKTDPAG